MILNLEKIYLLDHLLKFNVIQKLEITQGFKVIRLFVKKLQLEIIVLLVMEQCLLMIHSKMGKLKKIEKNF